MKAVGWFRWLTSLMILTNISGYECLDVVDSYGFIDNKELRIFKCRGQNNEHVSVLAISADTIFLYTKQNRLILTKQAKQDEEN